MLPVALYQAPHEKKAVERLVRFCLELDGTEIQVFTAPEPVGMAYPENANWSFRHVAEQMKGKAFIWIEADCSPLKAGWAKEISDEYKRVGKEYLYPAQMNPPFDNFTGIGVQSPNAFEHTPINEKGVGFDEVIARQFPDLIGRTDLIRHSYGNYDSHGNAALHEFPRDMSVIGSKAVLFHKDQRQGLLNVILPGKGFENETLAVSTSGDCGDIFVMLSILKSTGKQCRIYLREDGRTKGILERAHLVKSLLEVQPYIESVSTWKREALNWESERFRVYGYHNNGDSLAFNHANAAIRDGFIPSLPDVTNPWITVQPDNKWNDRVLINRTERWNGDYHFPWARIIAHYGKKAAFIGTEHEHRVFQERYGQLEYVPTANFLVVAQMIAGSALFMGNQSACMAIAEGLKHPRIQDVCLWCPDCLYPGANAQYSADGSMTLPAVGDTPELVIERTKPSPEVNINEAPPGYWQFPDCPPSMHPQAAVQFIRSTVHPEWSKEQALAELVAFNTKRRPDWFNHFMVDPELKKFMVAKRNAGLA